jgi:ribonuclease HII
MRVTKQRMGRKLSDIICLDKYTHIIGVDEVGWGALAGPIGVGGVLLAVDQELGIKDSKKYTTERSRQAAWDDISDEIELMSYRKAPVDYVDEFGYSESLHRLYRQVTNDLLINGEKYYDEEQFRPLVVVDGNKTIRGLKEGYIQLAVKKADSFVSAVSAASCLAKLSRDREMTDLDERYPEWVFHKNKGYGTRQHLDMLKKNEPLEGVHRMSVVSKMFKSK